MVGWSWTIECKGGRTKTLGSDYEISFPFAHALSGGLLHKTIPMEDISKASSFPHHLGQIQVYNTGSRWSNSTKYSVSMLSAVVTPVKSSVESNSSATNAPAKSSVRNLSGANTQVKSPVLDLSATDTRVRSSVESDLSAISTLTKCSIHLSAENSQVRSSASNLSATRNMTKSFVVCNLPAWNSPAKSSVSNIVYGL